MKNTETREERATALYRKTYLETEGTDKEKEAMADSAVEDRFGDEWDLQATGKGPLDVEVTFNDEGADDGTNGDVFGDALEQSRSRVSQDDPPEDVDYSDEDEERDDYDAQDGFYDDRESDFRIDGVGFAEPGGKSSLRAATRNNPRIHPCPNCGAENVLTPADLSAGYQCNACANAAEGGY